MTTLEKLANIFSRSQITLPKAVRELLRSDVVRIVVEDGPMRIELVEDVAGSLRRYTNEYVLLKETRESAWREALREKHARR